MWFEGHDPGRQTTVFSFVFQHGKHGLMAAVNPVKVANRQRAGLSQCWVLMAAKDFHVADYRFLVAAFSHSAGCRGRCQQIVMKSRYIAA
jgi:hypothetical protein